MTLEALMSAITDLIAENSVYPLVELAAPEAGLQFLPAQPWDTKSSTKP